MMKKTILLVAVIVLCLFQFGAAQAGQEHYTPTQKDTNTRTYFIHKASTEGGKLVLEAEPVEWYEGEAANAKFRELEPDSGLDSVPNDYYIVETGEELESITVTPDADIRMQIYNRTGDILEADIIWNEAITAGKFAELMTADDEWDMKDFPYHITVSDGKAVKIVQQYLP